MRKKGRTALTALLLAAALAAGAAGALAEAVELPAQDDEAGPAASTSFEPDLLRLSLGVVLVVGLFCLFHLVVYPALLSGFRPRAALGLSSGLWLVLGGLCLSGSLFDSGNAAVAVGAGGALALVGGVLAIVSYRGGRIGDMSAGSEVM